MAGPLEGVSVRDPDATLLDRARYGLGTTSLILGFVALVPGLIAVGLVTAFGPAEGAFLPTLIAGIAALVGGVVLQTGLEDPALTLDEMSLAVWDDDQASDDAREAANAQQDLAQRLLGASVRLDAITDVGLAEVVLAARRVAHLAAVDLSEALPLLARLVSGTAEESEAEVVATAHSRAASGLRSVEHMVDMLSPTPVTTMSPEDPRAGRRQQAQQELQALTSWVSTRQRALEQLDQAAEPRQEEGRA